MRIGDALTLTMNGAPYVTAVPNGTKLGSLRDKTDCEIDGKPYWTYTATVE